MSDKFNVFDEWGNKVGEYTPTGGSVGDGFIMVIALFLLWTVGFLVYTLFRLIGQGIKEIKLGNWTKAFGYMLIPVLVVFAMVVGFINTTVIEPATRANNEKIFQENMDQIVANPSTAIDVIDGTTYSISEACNVITGYCDSEHSLSSYTTSFRKFTIKNNTNFHLKLFGADGCVIEDWSEWPNKYVLKSQGVMTIYCPVETSYTPRCTRIDFQDIKMKTIVMHGAELCK